MEKKFDRYNIIRSLGEGTSGKVYLAQDTKLERNVALKVLKGNLEQKDLLERFFREARVTAKLDHPHIVMVYDFGKLDQSHFITMKYIEGASLQSLLDSTNTSIEEACQWMIEILDAIHHAHQMNFLHRDIKPSNILIDLESKSHLVDFGLAKILEKASSNISQGMVLGTCAYMSLEQATAGKVDKRSDIYSIGSVFYEILTGQKVFESSTILGMVYWLAQGDVEPPRNINPKIPLPLSQICSKAIERDKENRFQSAMEMKKAIENFLSHKYQGTKKISLPKKEQDWQAPSAKTRALTQRFSNSILGQKTKSYKRDQLPSFIASRMRTEKTVRLPKKDDSKQDSLPKEEPAKTFILPHGHASLEKKPVHTDSKTEPSPSSDEITVPIENFIPMSPSSKAFHSRFKKTFEYQQVSPENDKNNEEDCLKNQIDGFIKSQSRFTLVLIDLDHFSDYCEIAELQEIQKLLQKFLEIIVLSIPKNAYVYRAIASSSFIFILPETDSEKAFLLAETIRESMLKEKENFPQLTEHFLLSLSGSVVTYPETATNIDDLFSSAQNLLVQAKEKENLILYVQSMQYLPKQNFSCLEFVPRDLMESKIAEVLEKKGSQMLLLEGTLGIGKTRISQEIEQIGEDDNVFFYTCRETFVDHPYRTATYLINNYLQKNPKQIPLISAQMWDEEVSLLKPILKSFRGIETDPPSALAPDKLRKSIHQGICFILEHICSRQHITLVIDNFQWVDQVSLYAFEHVFRSPECHFFMIPALLQEKDSPINSPCMKMLPRFQMKDYFSTIHLEPFSDKEMEAFLISVLEHPYTPERTLNVLFQASRGNPTYIENVLKLLFYQRKLKRTSFGWSFDFLSLEDLPDGLEELTQILFKELEKESLEILEEAALIGENFQFNELEKITQKSRAEMENLLQIPEELGLIAKKSDGKYAFQPAMQDFIYHQLPEDIRKDKHHKIGKMLDDNFDPLVDDPSHVLYHFYRGHGINDASIEVKKFEKERKLVFSPEENPQIYAGTMKRRIRPVNLEDQELNESTTVPMVRVWMRELVLAVQQVQRYPKGSHFIENSISDLFQGLSNLFKEITGFIIEVQSDKLMINSYEFTLEDNVVANFHQLLKEHYINQWTCIKEVTLEELEKLVSVLTIFGQTIALNPEYWNVFLDESNICYINIVQKKYIEKEDILKKSQKILLENTEGSELDEESVILLRNVIRYFCASVENVQLYPPESKLLKFSIDLLVGSINSSLEKMESITFALANKDFLVNNYVANEKTFGHQITLLYKIFSDQGISSCSFLRGIKDRDIDLFVQEISSLEKKEEAFWIDFSKKLPNNLTINQHVYEELQIVDTIDNAPELFENMDLKEKVQHVLDVGKDDFLQEDAKEGLNELLETLSQQNQDELEIIIEKMVEFLKSNLVEMRLQIAILIGDLLENSLPPIKAKLLLSLEPEMEQILKKEEYSKVYPKLSKIAQHVIIEKYKKKEFKNCIALVQRMMEKHKEKLCPESTEKIIRDLLSNTAMSDIPFELNTEDLSKKFFINAFFKTVGKIADPFIVNAIGEIASQENRKKLAQIIHGNQDNIDRYLEPKLSQENPFLQLSRFFEVLPLLTKEPEKFCQGLVLHKDTKVIDLILSYAPSLKEEAAVALCSQIIHKYDRENTIVNALLALEKIKSPDTIELITEVSQKTDKLRIKKGCYRALSSIGDIRALPLLVETAYQKSLFSSEEEKEEKLFAQYALKNFSEKDIEKAKTAFEKSQSLSKRIINKITRNK